MGSCPDTDIDPIKALKQLFGFFFFPVFCLSVRNCYSYLAVTNVNAGVVMCLNPLEATGFIKTYFKPRLIQFCVYSYLSEWGGGGRGY